MIRAILSFSALSLFAFAAPQQVKVTVGENTFQINYSPETQDVPSVARAFCIQQQVALGYTDANPLTEANIGNCIQPLANYLQQQAAASAGAAPAAAAPPASKPVGEMYRVRVPVNGQEFEIRFRPDSEALERVAMDFCISQQTALGFNDQNPLTESNLPSCVSPIAKYLQTSILQYRQAASATAAAATATPPATAPAQTLAEIRVEVPIDGKAYIIRLREGQFVADIARQFCIEEQTSLGFNEANPLTTNNIALCVNPIATYLQNAVQKYNQQQQGEAAGNGATTVNAANTATPTEQMVAVQVTIGENTFEIRFQPRVESVSDVGRKFCVDQSQVLGVTSATLENCVSQVGQYLANALTAAK